MKSGDIGHLAVLVAFAFSLLSTIGFFIHTLYNPNEAFKKNENSWLSFARITYWVHTLGVFVIVGSLYFIIHQNQFEYHYAWSHSSSELPWYYKLSCFWEGQEGSFLLWICWHALLGIVLIRVNEFWEAPVMAVFMLVQTILISMIIGVEIPWIELKFGSSPFILLKDYLGDIPIYAKNPTWIPEDGTGLNPLLQNYWMVIHPPTLFLGFALTVVPFAYAVAGLWKSKLAEWVRPALPWSIAAAMVLGVGILMGGYWAYETLNFGGYWNWDPVENAVFVPWLVLVASLHAMISYKNSSVALHASFIAVLAMYFLIWYSTFLTRSGILGESSVHSFTDLGLSNQLGLGLILLGAVVIGLLVLRWKKIPSEDIESMSVFSREFWIFMGILVLSMSAFQVIFSTSIPVYNSFFKLVGFDFKMAPPPSQEVFYSNWQIWFGIGIATLSALGQFFWWKKMDPAKLWKALSIPLLLSVLVCSILLLLGILGWIEIRLDKFSYILLLLCSLFSIFANASIFFQVVKNNYRLTGGALAHMGVALMLIGILYSSGYSNVVSKNIFGLKFSENMSEQENSENILLYRNEPVGMDEFQLIYKGPRLEPLERSELIAKDDVIEMERPDMVLARTSIRLGGELAYRPGDSIRIHPENRYYEIQYTKSKGDTFALFPRIQQNKEMGTVASPDIKRFWSRDLYSHLSIVPLDESEKDWSPTKEYKVKQGDTVILNDYISVLEKLERIDQIPGIPLEETDISVKASVRVLGKNREYWLHPVFVIRTSQENIIGTLPDTEDELGLRVSLLNIDPVKEEFTLGVNTSQKDFVVMKVIEKPLVNLLWLGTLLLVLGFVMAMIRRYQEFKKMRDKKQEIQTTIA
ncbi:MAG: cytochrome c biogenesis protein CcsA [Cytophagaceae bacterium]|jgi:cytochrome c-type biogenesis protein CcmF|nr:cytochrome c biogenesis protein CcsA [Cytophagaceae bacterium]